jgi:hypothetical protein
MYAARLIKPRTTTVTLSWLSTNAKFQLAHLPRTQCSLPLTPTTVNSAPSKCLTDFLKKGNSVLLELRHGVDGVAPNMQNKLITHSLTAHNGVLYIHTMIIGKGEHVQRVYVVVSVRRYGGDGRRVNGCRQQARLPVVTVCSIAQ